MWYKTVFPEKEMDGMVSEDLTIIHNIEQHGLCGTAFSTYYLRLNGLKATAQGFCNYINSKTLMSGHKAYTEEDFKKKFPNIKPKIQK